MRLQCAYNANMSSNPIPFAGLSPDCVLNAIDSIGLHTDGRLLALNSYENRVYQVGIEDAPPLVVKFYRPERWSDAAILEEHAFVTELVQREVPVVAAVAGPQGHGLHLYEGFRFSLFPKRGGRAPELDRRGTLEWMGRFIARIHAVGSLLPYQERPTLDIRSFGQQSRDYLLENNYVPADLRAAWTGIVDMALQGVKHCYERAGTPALIRLHGDCHPGNVLWTDDGPHFVDFDDSRMGPAIQDLWMLLSGERDDMRRQMTEILTGYEDFCEFDERELHLIEALRTLRLIHYSAWLARRQDDPAFVAAFPWFNSPRYWQDRILELREQVALMEEAPLWSA